MCCPHRILSPMTIAISHSKAHYEMFHDSRLSHYVGWCHKYTCGLFARRHVKWIIGLSSVRVTCCYHLYPARLLCLQSDLTKASVWSPPPHSLSPFKTKAEGKVSRKSMSIGCASFAPEWQMPIRMCGTDAAKQPHQFHNSNVFYCKNNNNNKITNKLKRNLL